MAKSSPFLLSANPKLGPAMKRKILGVLFALVLVLSLGLVMALPASARPGPTLEVKSIIPTTSTNVAVGDDFVVTAEITNTGDATAYCVSATIDPGANASTTEPLTKPVDPVVLNPGQEGTVTWLVHCDGKGDTVITVTPYGSNDPDCTFPIDPGSLIAASVTIHQFPELFAYTVVPVIGPYTAGTAFDVTITAVDQFDDPLGDYYDPTGLTYTWETNAGNAPDTTAPDIAAPLEAGDFTHGVATKTVTLYCAESSVTFTVNDSSAKTGISDSITVNPGALASFTIAGAPASVYAGTAFPSPVTVTAYDAWDNVKTDYVGTVTWSSSASVSLPADYTFGVGEAGAHIFPGSQFTLFSLGTQTITVTDVATSVSATSSGIAVIAPTGRGAPPSDSTPPSISGVSASNITGTSADISWRTNEASTSQVEYWSSPSTLSPLDETMCFDHLVHLTGLTPGTTYHYKTMSKDKAGNLAVSDERTFTTLGEAEAAAFSVSDPSISPIDANIGETVTISVLVANTGDASGSYEVTLKINGVAEATKEATVGAGASEEVTFTTAKDAAGSYSVDVNGLSGSFTVKKPVPAPAPAPALPAPLPTPAPQAINWWLVGGIIAAVIVVGSVSFILVR